MSRGAAVAAAYLISAAVILVTVVALRGRLSPEALKSALGFFFICQIAGGLEPATVKAAVLAGAAQDRRPRPLGPILTASALKALAVAPVLALVWRFADPGLSSWALVWTPAVTIAGFLATDVRVLLDVEGRYASAIWLKQGTLLVGLLALAGVLVAGGSMPVAIAASSAARAALSGLACVGMRAGASDAGFATATLSLLKDRRWLDLAGASAIACAGGSVDRILALRLLPAVAYSGYYLAYEAFSRFWLLPYILTPILFARLAAGQPSRAFVRGAYGATAVAGAAFLSALGAALVVAPAATTRFTGLAAHGPLIVFAGGIVVAAFVQLRIAGLQGTGQTRRAGLVIALGALTSALLFWAAITHFGVIGLLVAWLAKGAIELAASFVPPGRTGERAGGIRSQPLLLRG